MCLCILQLCIQFTAHKTHCDGTLHLFFFFSPVIRSFTQMDDDDNNNNNNNDNERVKCERKKNKPNACSRNNLCISALNCIQFVKNVARCVCVCVCTKFSISFSLSFFSLTLFCIFINSYKFIFFKHVR